MSELIELDGGRLVLPTSADPAGAGHQRVGWRRYSVGLDVGGRGDDPSAVCIIKSESRPYMTGRGWQQALTPPEYTVVYTETVRLDDATDVVDWTVGLLRKLKNWSFAFDAGGIGAPLVGMYAAAGVPCTGIVTTAGSAVTRKGNLAYVSKGILFENAATCLETGQLRIAAGLPEMEKQALLSEMQSVEYAETSAGNLTLKAGGKGHHADRFSALCFSLINETHLRTQPLEVRKVSGYF